MKTYIVSITELSDHPTGRPLDDNIQHYLRRVTAVDVQPIITSLDASLKQLPVARAKRKDAGKSRSKPEAAE